MSNEGIGARLKAVRGETTQGDLALKLGTDQNTWGRYEREEREPGLGFLLLVRKKLRVNLDWLLSGEGRQYLPGAVMQEEAGTYDAGRFVEVPLYKDVRPRAGGGALVEHESEEHVEMRAFSQDWIRRDLRANPRDLALMHVEGDSMDDGKSGLKPGDVMMVNRTDTAATKDGVYVLLLDGALMVKRLQRLPGERLRVTSDNPMYQPFEVDLKARSEAVQIVGRVVYAWGGRRF